MTVTATGREKIHLVTRPSIDASWLDEELATLDRLVEEGDTLELVAKLAAMKSAPRARVQAPATRPLSSGPRRRASSAGSAARLP